MPLLKNNEILFIHIPKTGGYSIENILKISENPKLFGFRSINGITLNHSLQHATLQELRQLIPNELPKCKQIITVVRDPVARLFSELSFQGLSSYRNTFLKFFSTPKPDKKNIESFILDYLSSPLDGEAEIHRRPQHQFLLDNDGKIPSSIKILHTETLTKEFNTLGLGPLKVYAHKTVSWQPEQARACLTPKCAKAIWNFYKKDFEYFNYPNPCIQNKHCAISNPNPLYGSEYLKTLKYGFISLDNNTDN